MTIVAIDNNEFNNRDNSKITKFSAKSKNIKKLLKIKKPIKVRCLEQPNFLSSKTSSIFFKKKDFDLYFYLSLRLYLKIK